MTIQEMKTINKRNGYQWFSRGSMAFFQTKIHGDLLQIDGRFWAFITSEKPPHAPRAYSVRVFDADSGRVETIGEFCAHATEKCARDYAQRSIDDGSILA